MHAPRRSVISSQSKTFSQNKRRKKIVLLLLSLIVVGTVVFSLSRISSLQALTIYTVNVTGTDTSMGDSVRDLAMNEMQGYYFGIFSKSNFFIYPKQKILSLIYSAYPNLDHVDMERSRNILNIGLNEKKAEAVVCLALPEFDEDTLVQDITNCYLTDERGLVFDRVDLDSVEKVKEINRYYTPDALGELASSTDLIIGHFATSTQKFRQLQSVYNQIKKSGIDVKSLLIKPNGEYELYVSNPSTIIYLNDVGKLQTEVENLIVFWSNKVSTAKSKKEALHFDYIDARYIPNVFYRLNQ